MRTIRHWTPRYVRDRLALMWDERKHPDWPWLTRGMIGILETWLRSRDSGLEFGSGRSTTWFAKRVARLVSVEHDPRWHAIVSAELDALGPGVLGGVVDYRLREDGISGAKDSGYVAVARSLASAGLDFCLVDGVARDHCARASLDILKPGGILIVDNANWYIPFEFGSTAPNSRSPDDGYASDAWREVDDAVGDWRKIWTTNGVTVTALWQKPLT